jgi:hypothetical protein
VTALLGDCWGNCDVSGDSDDGLAIDDSDGNGGMREFNLNGYKKEVTASNPQTICTNKMHRPAKRAPLCQT